MIQRPKPEFDILSSDVIRLKDMVFQANHGCSDAEREIGATFTVNVELYAQLRRAANTDDLDHTLDVSLIYAIVAKVMMGKTYNLLETLTNRIATELMDHFSRIEAVRVRVHKDRAPLGGITGGYEVEMLLK